MSAEQKKGGQVETYQPSTIASPDPMGENTGALRERVGEVERIAQGRGGRFEAEKAVLSPGLLGKNTNFFKNAAKENLTNKNQY